MMGLQQALQHAKGMNHLTVDERNVEIVRMMGVRLIEAGLTREVRKALMSAVKRGYLGRLPKEGRLPEAFFHPNARSHAMDLRRRVERSAIEAVRKVCGGVFLDSDV